MLFTAKALTDLKQEVAKYISEIRSEVRGLCAENKALRTRVEVLEQQAEAQAQIWQLARADAFVEPEAVEAQEPVALVDAAAD